MKNKIILRPEEFTSFNSHYLESLWRTYFDISWYDSTATYHKTNTLFVVHWINADDDYSKNLRDQGYKVVVDNLWEVSTMRTDYYWLENPNWFWYNESLWWRNLGHHQYTPDKKYSKLALMPINRISHTRDQIVSKLGPLLDNFIWSYRDKILPNDTPLTDIGYQRFFNPDWYDDTYFSAVVETYQQGVCNWLSEKTFKACAYYHPFLLIGQHHTLKRLKQLGFETYDNIFDESYDDIVEFDIRFDSVIQNIKNFSTTSYDTQTQQKLKHNHFHFFNQDLATSRIISEIIEPLLHHAET